MSRIILVYFTIVFFCVGSFSHASSGKGDVNIKFRGQIVSAEVIGIPLRLILEKLKRERGIWFQGSDSVLDTKVSVRFKDLSVEEGLKRILSKVSYALFFDQNEKPVGLLVLDKGNSALSLPKFENIATGKKRSSTPEPTAGLFPTAKGLFSEHKAIDGDIAKRETHSLQSHEVDQKHSALKKFMSSFGNRDDFTPKKRPLFSNPLENATDADNPFVME